MRPTPHGGLRDWAPLLSQTRSGVSVLARIGGLRNQLLELSDALAPAPDIALALPLVSSIQHECRLLALGLELGSGVPLGHQRAGVLAPADLGLSATSGPRSFRRLLASPVDLGSWTTDRARERALTDFRAGLGREAGEASRDRRRHPTRLDPP